MVWAGVRDERRGASAFLGSRILACCRLLPCAKILAESLTDIPSRHNHCQDPFLSSALVGPQIQGIQSNNISACVKHWIFNNHECNRQSFSANVAERVGRELYTPGFFAAVDAGVGSVMCAL
eukprot:SAG25_NODE_878_length_4974_cov_1.376615_6_plen_122_part_00